jgi:hypothetical protein
LGFGYAVLNLSEFERLACLLEQGTRLAEPATLTEQPCLLIYKEEHYYYQLWVRNVAVNLTPVDFLILSGLATGASWLFYFRALQLGNASWVAPLDKLSLVFILILSVVFLGDPLTWQVIIGSLLIVTGTLMFVL